MQQKRTASWRSSGRTLPLFLSGAKPRAAWCLCSLGALWWALMWNWGLAFLLVPFRRASLHFQLLLSLSTKALSISQLLLWAGGKSGFWRTGCSEWQFLDFGQVSYFQATLLDMYNPAPCLLLLLSVWLCKFPCCHIPCQTPGPSAETHRSWFQGAACSTQSQRSQFSGQHHHTARPSDAEAVR